MLLLGTLALIQTVFLPGVLILYFAGIKTQSIIQKYIYIFALSLFVNYSVVTILVLIDIYFPSVMLSIIVLETFLLAYLVFTNRISFKINLDLTSVVQKFKDLFRQKGYFFKALIISSMVIVIFYFSLLIANIGTIFYFTDTVNNIHWNTWAIDFSNNIFPKHSSHFPQLIPSNWSISYLLTGERNIHFFPKSIMPLFFLGNIFMFWDLAISKRNLIYLIALIIYGLFGPIVYNLVFIADGNGDLPVSFFAFLSFYAYLKTDKEKFQLNEYIIVFLFASTAAGTKLAGFYVFFFMSILCLYYLLINFKNLTKKESLILVIFVVLILGVNLFWYFMKPEVMTGGLHQPEWLAESYSNILKNALLLLYYNWGLPVIAFLALTIFFSLFVQDARYISLFFVIPPVVLWMFKYSSDFRNLSFVVPFISYVSAFGIIKIIELAMNKKIDLFISIKSTIKDQLIISHVKIGFYFIVLPIMFFLLANSNAFYKIIYGIYTFISKYYFQSNRITYFIDFTFFVHVDYYQNVLAVLALTITCLTILYLFKIKIKHILIFLFIGTIILNFTLLTRENIIAHQQNALDKVDARNYYFRISTIIKSANLDSEVFTNFAPICVENIQRELNFNFLTAEQVEKLLNQKINSNNKLLFLKLKNLKKQIQTFNDIINIYYDDGSYILFNFK